MSKPIYPALRVIRNLGLEWE